MLLRGGRAASRRPGDHLALARAPSGGEIGSERRIRRLRRRDTLPARGLEAALPAAAEHGLPVLAAAVAGRLVRKEKQLDVGDRRVAREVLLGRRPEVADLRLLADDRDVLLVVVLRI